MEFSFKPVTLKSPRPVCHAPVAATVRKCRPGWVSLRINGEVMKRTGWKAGAVLSPFLDETNRAILLLSDQRPIPDGSRKLYTDKGTSHIIDFPLDGPLKEWFGGPGPMRPMVLIEAKPGRLVFQVP